AIILLSANSASDPFDGLGGSEYLKIRTGEVTGDAPECDLEGERNLIETLVELSSKDLLSSAHDVSEGGIAVTLAECCFGQATEQPIGARVTLTISDRVDRTLFGERQG